MNERTRKLAQKDKTHLWHPFTQMQDWRAEAPLIIERGEGTTLFDTEGNAYIDGVSSLWCNVHGHRRPEIDRAIRDQLDRVAHSTMLGLTAPPAVELAERLTGLAPDGLNKVFYSDSGSTAMEIALKIAFQYWQQATGETRPTFIALDQAYHGDTIGAVSLGGISLFHETYRPLLFSAVRAPCPHPYRSQYGPDPGRTVRGCLDAMDALLGEHAGRVAAVVVEPLVQGAAGILVHPPGYLRGVRELCDRHGTLLICDEVAVGFGRTGRMFACEHEAVAPDIMAVGKGLTGGYLPLAATLATQDVFEAFLDPAKTFYHGHTYTGNALACAVAVASLKRFDEAGVLEAMPAKIDLIAERLAAMWDLPGVARTRQCGMMAGIDIARPDGVPFDPSERMGAAVCEAARGRGILIRPLGDTLILMPAPAMDTETLEAYQMRFHELSRLIDIYHSNRDSILEAFNPAFDISKSTFKLSENIRIMRIPFSQGNDAWFKNESKGQCLVLTGSLHSIILNRTQALIFELVRPGEIFTIRKLEEVYCDRFDVPIQERERLNSILVKVINQLVYHGATEKSAGGRVFFRSIWPSMSTFETDRRT